MDTNFLRQKISELTKKYSNKKVSIDEDLSLSDDYSVGLNDTVKYSLKSDILAKSDAGDIKNTSQSANKSVDLEPLKSPRVITPKSVSSRSEGKERSQLIDTPRSRSINSLRSSEHSDFHGITEGSRIVGDEVDNFSDLFSDEELENLEEIDEVSDDSSDYQPFKNIHLVSDDFMEDIHTASDESLHSEDANERLTNRSTKSTSRSIRSIPLSPFISPPVTGKRSEAKIKEVTSENDSLIEEQLKSDANASKIYETSFEEEKNLSDNGSRSLEKSRNSSLGTLKRQTPSSRRSSLSRISGKTEENFESSTSASIVKTPSASSKSSSNSSKNSGKSSENLEEILESDTNKRSSESEERLHLSRSRERGKGNRKETEEEGRRGERQKEEKCEKQRGEKAERERQREEEERIIAPSESIKSVDSCSDVISELLDSDISDRQISVSSPFNYFVKSKDNSKVADKQSEVKTKEKSEKILHKTGLKNQVSKREKPNNKYVQCDLISDDYRLQRSHRRGVPIYYDFESNYREENILDGIQPRRKPMNVDTRVKNVPNRPVITTNVKLFDVKCLENDLDFHIDCDNKIEDYNLNPIVAMDRILRNQIHLTKYFMESHHKMYMACCKIVKSMSEDYNSDGTMQDNR
ncbi:hypothetical protein LSTR_LSTR006521 [Laodelphax striatellus]|uniref:Uncharacterized protein n=1 Tax=Laodelphax striatellus TaxID=195883 RepID=A0A482WXY7_LAOST|nr:hypothetical protein LSTR_LSTR006521 [Laodelphax striatellus]